MKRFRYKARDSSGNMATGEVEAASHEAAARLLRKKDLVVISIKLNRGFLNFGVGVGERITLPDLSTITRQLSTMINSGLPLTESLLILRSQAKGVSQKIIGQVLADVEEGESLSSALSKFPKVFSKTYIALIRAGETGGVLDQVLLRLADNLENQQEFRGKVKGALIYPAIIIIGMIGVSLVMLIFVIPRLMSLYEQFEASLPLPTLILMSISNFMARYWPFVLALIGLSVYGAKIYRKTAWGRKKTDELIFKIPIFGPLQREVILAEITRTLGMMVGSGVSIIESLNIAADVVSNVVISEALKDAAKLVEKGFPVAYSFSRHPEAFPYILCQMLAVGEETGKMDEVLAKVSHVFEVESDQKVKAMTAAVEPAVLIILGVGVAFLVIAVILPIYNLTSKL